MYTSPLPLTMESVYTIALERGKYFVLQTTSRADNSGVYWLPDSLSMTEVLAVFSAMREPWLLQYRPLYVVSKLPGTPAEYAEQLEGCVRKYGSQNVRGGFSPLA